MSGCDTRSFYSGGEHAQIETPPQPSQKIPGPSDIPDIGVPQASSDALNTAKQVLPGGIFVIRQISTTPAKSMLSMHWNSCNECYTYVMKK